MRRTSTPTSVPNWTSFRLRVLDRFGQPKST
jgi:hypothetical protein